MRRDITFPYPVPFELWDRVDDFYARGSDASIEEFSGMIDKLQFNGEDHVTVHYTTVPQSYLEFNEQDKNGYWYVDDGWYASVNGITIHAPFDLATKEAILKSIDTEERNTL